MKIKITATAHHRNGVTGRGFTVCLFHAVGGEFTAEETKRVLVAILANNAIDDDSSDRLCFVLSVPGLAAGDIAFGSNSFRGDVMYELLAPAIREFEEKERGERSLKVKDAPKRPRAGKTESR